MNATLYGGSMLELDDAEGTTPGWEVLVQCVLMQAVQMTPVLVPRILVYVYRLGCDIMITSSSTCVPST